MLRMKDGSKRRTGSALLANRLRPCQCLGTVDKSRTINSSIG